MVLRMVVAMLVMLFLTPADSERCFKEVSELFHPSILADVELIKVDSEFSKSSLDRFKRVAVVKVRNSVKRKSSKPISPERLFYQRHRINKYF